MAEIQGIFYREPELSSFRIIFKLFSFVRREVGIMKMAGLKVRILKH